MAKAPNESRIPLFSSRIPKPGNFRILPNTIRNPNKEPSHTQPVRVAATTTPKNGTTKQTQPHDKENQDITMVVEKKINQPITKDNMEHESTFILDNVVMFENKLEFDKNPDSSIIDSNVTVVLDSNKAEAIFIQNQGHNETMLIDNDIVQADIGKKVCVGGVQNGTLKYVGPVEFNTGIWCGIELESPVGRHDGSVKGTRYFSCRNGYGIMAPIAKVVLTCPSTLLASEQKSSGPYSLIGIEIPNNDTYNLTQSPDEVEMHRTLVIKGSDQGLTINPESVPNKRLTQLIESDKTFNQDNNKRRSRIVAGVFPNRSESLDLDNSPMVVQYSTQHSTSTPVTKERNKRKSADDTPESLTSMISPHTDISVIPLVFGNPLKKFASPLNSPVETPSVLKQNSFEMDESLGILTPNQMKEFPQFAISSKTPSSDDLKSVVNSKVSSSDKTISNSRTPSSENLGSLPHDGFKLPSPSKRPDNIQLQQAFDIPTKGSPSMIEPSTTDFSLGLIDDNLMINTNMFPSTSTRHDSIELKQLLDLSGKTDMASPNQVDQSTMDFSLGLIDEDMLVSGTFCRTTTNLDLPLDPINLDEKMTFTEMSRFDQTPSPEDLPLDPDSKMELLDPPSSNPSESEPKTDSKASTNTKTNSFITSITSITSLDTGYQGDGEMSRPASRGADHSPIAHKLDNSASVNQNWQRAIVRRQDPMTDSDFFTESDADIHGEAGSKGDRKAQVIDGTLYGVNSQNAPNADIYIANHDEMDSSGIFTDLDTNPRTDDFSDIERNKDINIEDDKSPDVSTKTISENSQELKEITNLENTLINNSLNNDKSIDISNDKIPKSPTLSISSTQSRKSPRTRTPLPKDESPNKKFKMPKRNVQSKIKTMMGTANNENQENRKPVKKNVNRWDAVMNKISKGQENTNKIRLNQVKSKVASGIAGNSPNKRTENLKDEDVTKPKIRRVRARSDQILPGKANSRTATSIHSSVSDLSVGVSPSKTTSALNNVNRSAKKRDVVRCATPVTELLTPTGTKPAIAVSPRSASRQQRTLITRDLKKSPVPVPPPDGKAAVAVGRRTPSRRSTGAAVNNKSPNKDQSRVSGTSPPKGGSPVHPQVLQIRSEVEKLLPHSAKGVEALGVLVQYLVFNLDAFRTPSLKRELQQTKTKWLKDKLDLEETRMGYRRLEDALAEQKIVAQASIEQERIRCRAEITELFEKHRRDVAELKEKSTKEIYEIEARLKEENIELKLQLDEEITNREHEISVRIEAYADEQQYKFQDLNLKNERLRQEHQIALEILREENDSIREQLEEKQVLLQEIEDLKMLNEKLKVEFNEKERWYEEKLTSNEDEIALLKEENRKILETFKSDTKDNKLQSSPQENVVSQAALGRCTQLQDEVESLRSVLDLKLAELSDLRRAHGELSQAAEELPGALHRCQTLQARVEDLELQLARKTEVELQLTQENKRLLDSCSQESKQRKRLSLYNEELQWKLKQNSEVVNAILQGQTPTRKSLHGSNQSLCDDSISSKTPGGGFLSRSLHTSSFNEKHYGTPHVFERTLSFRERSKTSYFDLDDSPPSSPKVKGVVDKGDSVSWVLDMDESPEVLASRMVRRAGSFRNVTPPKSTPTKSPATKRPRTKSNNLCLSASAGAIVGLKTDNRHRSKSVSLRDSQSPENNPANYLSNSWHYSLCTSTPTKTQMDTIRKTVKLENNPDLEHDTGTISLPALPSEIRKADKTDGLPSLPSGDLMLLQSSFPKNSAGEALISESNSEDECSSSTGERSPSVSDTETSEERSGSADGKCYEKHSKLQYDLFLMSESTANSEIMDCSWSEDLDS